MPRSHFFLLLSVAFTVLTGNARPLAAQSRVAPCYSLPKDGAWIEFDWRATGPDNKEQTGILRISSVGTLVRDRTSHRWIEIKKEAKNGKQPDFKLRKILIAEKAFEPGQSLEAHVIRGYGQSGADAPVIALPPPRIHELLTLGIEGPDAALVKVRETEELQTNLCKFQTRHLSATGKHGDRQLEYHCWLTSDLPFGCAKFTIQDRTGKGPPRLAFRAIAVRQGRDAASDLDESKAR